MLSFSEWAKKKGYQLDEMAGTDVVMGNTCKTPDVGPDAQVQGDPAASCKKMLLNDKKKLSKK